MAVKDGNPVNDAYTNSQLASKKEDNTLEGIQSLQNTDLDSGAPIANLQKSVNENIQDIDALETTVADHETRITQNESDIADKIDLTEKGSANGVATLDASGLIPSNQLPSYVDDVLEFADVSSFPVSGETGKIYIDLSTSNGYRWTGSVYTLMSSGIASTDDLAEGSTNLYHTEARVNSLIQAASIGDLSNVDTSVSPTDGQVLAYNNVSGNFEPADQSGGGVGGGFNLEEDPYAQNGAGTWSLYNDSSPSPVDLTGGTVDPGVTFFADKDSIQILGEQYKGAFILSKDAANRQGHGVSKQYLTYPGVMASGYIVKTLRYSTDVDLEYGDIELHFRDNTNTDPIEIHGIDENKLPACKANEVQKIRVLIPIKNNTGSIQAGFHIATDKTTAFNFYFSDINISDEYQNNIFDTLPVGATMPFGGPNPPDDFLMCDGAAISRSEYAELFSVIGTAFGQGNGSTTFNLPDLRGLFIRGAEHMGTAMGLGYNDPDGGSRTHSNGGNIGNYVGSQQGDDYKTHKHIHPHTFSAYGSDSPAYGWAVVSSGNGWRHDFVTGNAYGRPWTSSAGGSETRPKNVYFNYIIRYRSRKSILNTFELIETAISLKSFGSGSQTYNNSTHTTIELNQTINDTLNLYNKSTFTLTVKKSGFYKVKPTVKVSHVAGGSFNYEDHELFVNVDGTRYPIDFKYKPRTETFPMYLKGEFADWISKDSEVKVEILSSNGAANSSILLDDSYVIFELDEDKTRLGMVKSNEQFYGVYDLTVTGNNGWSTSAAKGIVRKEGDYFTIEMQIEGTSNSTNQVDLTVSDLVGHPDYNYQSINTVGAFSSGQATNGGFRKLTEQIELRTSSNDTTWNCNGKIFLDSLPAFVGA